MPFFDEFNRYEGLNKIIRIMVNLTKMEPTVVVKSIVEKDPEEKARVDFMVQHIQFMESVNSNAFDREILKKAKPAEDAFVLPESKAEQELLHEIFRCLQTVTQGDSTRVVYAVCHTDLKNIVFAAGNVNLFSSSTLMLPGAVALFSLLRPTVRLERYA